MSEVAFDLELFSGELAAAVAVQNGEAFEGNIAVEESAAQGVAQPVAFTDGAPDLADIEDAAQAFDDSLATPADATFAEQDELLDDTSQALDVVSLQVDETVVSVAGAAVVDTADGTSQVVVDLHIVRSLSSGIDWEEVVPYVSTVDASTGEVLSMEVHDDVWLAANPPAAADSGPLPAPTSSSGVYVLPAAAASSSSELAAERPAAATALTAAQRNLVVRYALQYWSVYNPAYLTSPQDCTNFASQALFAGGWTKVTGLYTSDSVWWYTGNPLIPKSYTWASAQNFYNFAISSGRASRLSSVYSLRLGNILQYDIEAAGMNHTMIVTAIVNGEPYLTYHTGNHVNKPFSAVRAAVLLSDSTPIWYALST